MNGLRKDGSEFRLELSLDTWRTRERAFYSRLIRAITERRRREEAFCQHHTDKHLSLRRRG
ncbi:MAG: hypothetical protein EXR97_01670 [Nitrospiraceae bacterium]|nr:hypothetical protein [Nitrospiraceae bacterium]MSR24373.1 hypothetical protein [Nitrospiraceae bacterium]